MPCYGITIAEAVARKQSIKWFTGLLARPYLPWSFDHSPSLPNGLAQVGELRAPSSVQCLWPQ